MSDATKLYNIDDERRSEVDDNDGGRNLQPEEEREGDFGLDGRILYIAGGEFWKKLNIATVDGMARYRTVNSTVQTGVLSDIYF